MDVPVWRGIWDSWNISGGNHGSGFRTLPGHEDDPRLIHDDPARTGEPFPSWPGWCAGGPRMLLDVSDFREMSRTPTTGSANGRPLFWPDVLTLDGWWIEDGLHPRHGVCDEALLVKLRCHG